MSFLNFNTVSALVFVALLVFFLWKDRKNIERQGIVFVRRTKKGIKILECISMCCPKFWKILSTFGVGLAYCGSVFIFFFLIGNVLNGFISTNTQPGLALVLPSFSNEFKLLPGVFLTPFWYWIIGIFVMIVVHEGFHGIVGLVEKFKLNSVGWAILGILPAAFVEPEGEQNIHTNKKNKGKNKEKGKVEGGWQGGSLLSRLRVLGAGSLGNFVLAGLVMLIVLASSTSSYGGREIKGVYDHTGITIFDVANNSPAYFAGIPNEMNITYLDNKKINSITDFHTILATFNPGNPIYLLSSNNKTYSLILSPYPKINLKYNPSVWDYVQGYVEPVIPIIDWRERGEHPLKRLSRWNWIKDNFDHLDNKAEQKISAINSELSKKAYIGISVVNRGQVKEPMKNKLPFISFMYGLLSFLVMVNVGVGMANLMPIKPLDGGVMWEELLTKISKKKGKLLSKILAAITLVLIVLGFATSLF